MKIYTWYEVSVYTENHRRKTILNINSYLLYISNTFDWGAGRTHLLLALVI